MLDESRTHKYEICAKYTGDIDWIISESFTTVCKMDVLLFPFDTHTCSLDISGLGPTARLMNFSGLGIGMDAKHTLINNAWQLNSHSVQSQYYQDYQGYFSIVQFQFTVRRKPDFYIATMIIPLFTLSFLGLLVFVLPAESGERISLGISCLLSFSVIQASITEQLPPGFSDMPHVGE